jgi:hypothetical protein
VKPSLSTRLRLSSGVFLFGFLSHNSFREFLGSRFTVPLFESLIRDFSLDQKLRFDFLYRHQMQMQRVQKLERGFAGPCRQRRVLLYEKEAGCSARIT